MFSVKALSNNFYLKGGSSITFAGGLMTTFDSLLFFSDVFDVSFASFAAFVSFASFSLGSFFFGGRFFEGAFDTQFWQYHLPRGILIIGGM